MPCYLKNKTLFQIFGLGIIGLNRNLEKEAFPGECLTWWHWHVWPPAWYTRQTDRKSTWPLSIDAHDWVSRLGLNKGIITCLKGVKNVINLWRMRTIKSTWYGLCLTTLWLALLIRLSFMVLQTIPHTKVKLSCL